MATRGRGSGVVGYNVQAAVDTKHKLIAGHHLALGKMAMADDTSAALR
jgi:hypothetical protein